MPLSFFNKTITVIKPATIERNGKPMLDWSNATTVQVTKCHVQPSTTDRDLDGRQVSVSDEKTLYAPISADIDARDRILYEGVTYTINGEPQKWESPTGRVSQQQVRIKRWQG